MSVNGYHRVKTIDEITVGKIKSKVPIQIITIGKSVGAKAIMLLDVDGDPIKADVYRF